MQTTTIVFMILVLGLLWGGFGVLLVHSMRTDRRRGNVTEAGPGEDRD